MVPKIYRDLSTLGDPQIVNHDEEGAEICAAFRFRWFSYDDVMHGPQS